MSRGRRTDDRLAFLEERVRYIEEANRNYVAILDLLASGDSFMASLNQEDLPREAIFRASLEPLRRLFPFAGLGFFDNQDDSSFNLTVHDPPSCRDDLLADIEALIQDGTFAWAINRNRAITVPSPRGEFTIVLHVIATQTRIRGMFAGLLPGGDANVDAPTLNALSVILLSVAHAIESRTLNTLLREHLHNLEDKVRERTGELLAARNQAEAANMAKSAFLATMSHELRTPMNAIIGFTDVVLGKNYGPLNDLQEEYLGYVLQSSRHLLSLINDILDLSKIEAEKMDLASEEVDVRSLVAGSLVMVKEQALRGNVRLYDETAAEVGLTIWADPRKMKQILFNLLTNAVKFTPSGGEVRVNVRKLSGDFPAQGDVVLFSVTDTGMGLKNEDLETIFSPFVQVDSSHTREFEGTGLGLSLTRKLIELHRGVIWAESEGPGKGSRFFFTLPISRQGTTK